MDRFAGALTLLLALTGAAGASPLGEEYLRLQSTVPVIRGFAIEQLQAEPEVFEGSLIEVRGRVAAVLGSERRPLLLLRSPDHPRALRLVPPAGRSLQEWPFLEVGAAVRVLARMPSERRGSDTLEIVLPVPEAEAAEAEAAAPREPEPAPEAVPPPHPVPAMQSPDEALLRSYAAGMRHFNRRLTDANARFIAERVIAESRDLGIDGRLLVAVLAVEGSLDRMRFSPRGAYLGERPARDAIASAARDLKRRLHRAASRGGKSDERVAAALASRRRDLTAGAPPSRAQVEAYSGQVTQLYAELRGERAPQVARETPTANHEAGWSKRRWGTPPGPLVGTWEGAGESFVVVINASGSGVAGSHGEQIGLWRESGGYLEFRTGRVEPLRFRWRISDDRKALTVTRLRADRSVVGTTTLLRR